MRIPIILIFLLTLVDSPNAQTGPGGVGTTDGTSDLVLWLTTSDFQQDGFIDGDAITAWPDISGYNSDAGPGISGNPTFVTNVINNLPSVRFARATTNYLQGTLNANAEAPMTIFVVGIFSGNPQIAGSGQYLIGLGGGTVSQISISREAPSNQYYSFNGSSRSLGPAVNSQWHIFSSQHNTTAPYHTFFLDNTLQTVNNDYGAPFATTNANYSLGRNMSGLIDTYLDGDVAEVIVIDRLLNIAESTIIANYLSSKFDLPISNDLYTGDTNGAGNFDLQVAGIGAETNGAQTQASSAGLMLDQNSGFGFGDFVIVGHRSSSNSVNAFDISEPGNSLEARWTRTWFMDVTDANASTHVDVTFDFSESGLSGNPGANSNYRLIRQNLTNWEIVPATASITGDRVTFTNLHLTDGVYTLATTNISASPLISTRITGVDGPAALGSTTGSDGLLLWLDASRITGLANGAALAEWTDLALAAQNATQPTPALQPVYVANVQNGLPVVNFDGTNDFLQGNFGDLDAPMTIVAVARFNQTNQGPDDNDYVFDVGLPSPLYDNPGIRASISRRRNDDVPARTDRFYTFAGDFLNYGPVITAHTFHVFTSVHQTAAPFHQLYFNGARVPAASGNMPVNTNGIFHVGRLNDQPGNFFLNGDIAEIVVYNSILNEAEILVLQNSLSSKWNTSITNDFYDGDIMANGNNDLSVSGVARTISGDMAQGDSDGMMIGLSLNAGNNSSILFGHNAPTNSVVVTDNEATNGTITQRIARTWYLTLTGSTGNSNTIQFDYSRMGITGAPSGNSADFGLLYRAVSTDEWTIIATASSLTGDQVNFQNVNLAATGSGFYCLGSLNGAALPVTLTSFNAFVVEENKYKATVIVNWSTSTEKDNNFFTIERSVDAVHWESIATVPSKQKPGPKNDYTFIDSQPRSGRSYYRLRQTDYDGTSEQVGEVKMVNVKTQKPFVQIYPNPAGSSFRIVSSLEFEEACRFSIMDAMGREIYTGPLERELVIPNEILDGVYHFTIISRTRENLSTRLIIQK